LEPFTFISQKIKIRNLSRPVQQKANQVTPVQQNSNQVPPVPQFSFRAPPVQQNANQIPPDQQINSTTTRVSTININDDDDMDVVDKLIEDGKKLK